MANPLGRVRPVLFAALCGAVTLSHASACSDSGRAEQTASLLRERALVDGNGFELIESLTTDIGPRLAGSAADANAVVWAVAKFRSLGYDKVYTEPVSFPVWQRVTETATVTAPVSQRLAIAALGGSVGSGGPMRGEVVSFLDIKALSIAPAESIRGKIVLLTQRMVRQVDGSGYASVLPMRSTAASIAAGKGALAILIRSLGTDSDRLPHTGSVIYEEGKAIPAAAVSGPDADLLERLLGRPVPVTLTLNIEVASRGSYTSHNVIGEITGSGAADEIVMLGAHLDSWDLGTGAIDDGFGVGVTMAAGAMMKQAASPPKRTVRVVLFANEENGFDGAKAYAAGHAAELAKHRTMAESDWGAGRIYALRHVEAERCIALAMARVLAPLGIALDSVSGVPGPDIGFIGKPQGNWVQLAQDASELFDVHHTANDTLDKIDPDAVKQNVAAYAAFAWLMAN